MVVAGFEAYSGIQRRLALKGKQQATAGDAHKHGFCNRTASRSRNCRIAPDKGHRLRAFGVVLWLTPGADGEDIAVSPLMSSGSATSDRPRRRCARHLRTPPAR